MILEQEVWFHLKDRAESWLAFQTDADRGRAPGTARPAMQDVVMLLFTVVFFVLAFLYVKACQKLR